MAVTEVSGLMKYKDANGNVYLMLPITTKDNVDGIDEIESQLSETIRYTAQTLSDEQKTQARTNIGAVSADELSIDTTLSVGGQAADAKVVGDAFATLNVDLDAMKSEVNASITNITSDLTSAISAHNSAIDAHADIREVLIALTNDDIDEVCVIIIPAGLYKDGVMAISWDDLVGELNSPYDKVTDGVFYIDADGFSKSALFSTMSITYQKDDHTISMIVGKIVIDENVDGIYSYCFYGCTGLTEVVLPQNVSSIGQGAFKDCSNLTSINLSENMDAIGMYSFSNTGLTSIKIPSKVTGIYDEAFYGCSNLTDVVIGSGVQNIAWGAFGGCSQLTSITFEGTMAQWNSMYKETGWYVSTPLTQITCSDGTVTLK